MLTPQAAVHHVGPSDSAVIFEGHMDVDKVDRALRTAKAGTSQSTGSDSTVGSAVGTLSLPGKPWGDSDDQAFPSLSRARAHSGRVGCSAPWCAPSTKRLPRSLGTLPPPT